MKVQVKSYPAQNGDCFLVTFGEFNEKQKHLLIDFGFVNTYNNYLKRDLRKISGVGECLEKVVVTHIDADHIQGAIRFFKENNSERLIEIKQVWHNSFRHLIEKKEHETSAESERILRQILRRGYPKNENKYGEQTISAEQGTTLGALILQGNYSWNDDFGNGAICIENKREIPLGQDSSIYLLSPNWEKLNDLKELWKDELRKYGINYTDESSQLYDDAFEMLLSWEKEKRPKPPKQISSALNSIEELLKRPFEEDDTATNGSSIAFILQIQNRKLLFLADAHPSLIAKSLSAYQEHGRIHFDLIKVAHHGSFGNINRDLLNKIDSEKYLFSTNGSRHNHPDQDTIAHIISRNADFHRKLYFNYVTNNSEYFKNAQWMKKYNYSIHYLNEEPYSLEL